MTIAAGLLGSFGRPLTPDRVEEALRRAPWRGQTTMIINRPFGTIIALGSAKAGVHHRVAIAMHGRIDNLADLSYGLNVDPTDTCAVLAETYLKHGNDFAGCLLGDFSILLLDDRRKILLATRDWIGTRPLFWGEHKGEIAFGSEVKQVLALLDRPYELDEEVAAAYATFTGDMAVDATFAKGIRAIIPSSQVVHSASLTPQVSHREIRFAPVDLPLREAALAIRGSLEVAVKRRLGSSRRPSALVSGGMDSTSVAAVAASLGERGLVPPLIAGVSLQFPEVPQSDESSYSRDVAEKWGFPWYPVTIDRDVLIADPSDMLALHDGPVFPGIHFFHELFAEAHKHGADVILTGQIADAWQTQINEELKFSVLRHEWRSALNWTRIGFRRDRVGTLKRLARSAQVAAQRRSEGEFFAARAISYGKRAALETEERLGQYYGLRTEAPFADRELAELLSGVSPAFRSNERYAKLPMRMAMAELLPKSILERLDKSFFDPVFTAAFGEPETPMPAGRMITTRYLSSWRAYQRRMNEMVHRDAWW